MMISKRGWMRCAHCAEAYNLHAGDKCLYESTWFEGLAFGWHTMGLVTTGTSVQIYCGGCSNHWYGVVPGSQIITRTKHEASVNIYRELCTVCNTLNTFYMRPYEMS